MKKLLLLFVGVSLFFNANAQSFEVDENEEVVYSEVINVTLSKKQFYSNVEKWAKKNLGGYHKAVRFDDGNGTIILSGSYTEEGSTNLSFMDKVVHYDITIESLNDKCRYTIYNILIQYNGSILGANFFSEPFSLTNNLKAIKEKTVDLQELETMDTSEMEPGERKIHQESISKLRDFIKTAERMKKEESGVIVDIGKSFKKAISKKK